MMDFKTYMEQQVGIAPQVQSITSNANPTKPWKAKKADVLSHWKNLTPNMPIKMMAVPETHKGTRFRSDGFRVTGSPEFINSILSRVKDMADFESGDNRLDIEYRQIGANASGSTEAPDYVFYCHLVKKEEKPKKPPKIKV